ncbi:hypothetical protein [Lysobacter capsici]|nr:hypothetical protein [Lysobacter capsici]
MRQVLPSSHDVAIPRFVIPWFVIPWIVIPAKVGIQGFTATEL